MGYFWLETQGSIPPGVLIRLEGMQYTVII